MKTGPVSGGAPGFPGAAPGGRQGGPGEAALAAPDRTGGQPHSWGMGDAPDIHEIARQVAVLKERMTTSQATYETALERRNAAFERPRADMAARETRMIVTVAATVIGGGNATG